MVDNIREAGKLIWMEIDCTGTPSIGKPECEIQLRAIWEKFDHMGEVLPYCMLHVCHRHISLL